jgi:hypothetical protein
MQGAARTAGVQAAIFLLMPRCAPLHDRMPLILAQTDDEQWLDPTHDPANLIRPCPPEEMTAWPIGTQVNRPNNMIPESSQGLDRVYRTRPASRLERVGHR